jgi:hypothetical protein
MKVICILVATLINSVFGAVVNNSITLPTNECGYSNVVYNDSLSQFNPDDTVKFYNFESEASNCGPQNTTLGCVHLQHMTGPFSIFGYNPYTIWYYPYPINNSYTMNLFYNYNGGSTVMIGAVPCDDQLYMLGLTKCAFNQQLFSYQFYKYYLFDFFIKCSYNGTTMSLKIDESSDTCVGFERSESRERSERREHEKCIINHNIATLVDFQDWVPVPFDYAYDISDFGVYTSSTVELPTITLTTATVTQNVTETATTILNITESTTVTETMSGANATATVTETQSGVNATATVTETLSGANATATVTETTSATITEIIGGVNTTVTETIGGSGLTVTETMSATITETVGGSGLTVTETTSATVTETVGLTITETVSDSALTVTESATVTETLTITETNTTTSTNTSTTTTI